MCVGTSNPSGVGRPFPLFLGLLHTPTPPTPPVLPYRDRVLYILRRNRTCKRSYCPPVDPTTPGVPVVQTPSLDGPDSQTHTSTVDRLHLIVYPSFCLILSLSVNRLRRIILHISLPDLCPVTPRFGSYEKGRSVCLVTFSSPDKTRLLWTSGSLSGRDTNPTSSITGD